jgi:hypothetical protein
MDYPNARLRRHRQTKITPIEAVQIVLTNNYDISLHEVNKNTRLGKIVKLRQVVQACLSRNTRISLADIGKMTGHKDHATVINSTRKIENMEHMFKNYGTQDAQLTFYYDFENRYFATMSRNRGIVQREYRSYKDELKKTAQCT